MFGLHLRSSSPPTSPGYLPPGPSRRSSAASSSSRSCKNLDDDHTRDLWHCMLDLQERYACYHSARIDVAMEAGDRGDGYMPSRFIIDTLNDSVIDLLPEQALAKLNRHLHP